VLVGLYEEPERPGNAVDYIKRYMGAPANVDVEGLKVSSVNGLRMVDWEGLGVWSDLVELDFVC
jgi:hypothetical protein